ncbi:hypothetical protein JHK82_038712 [Glycine max]|nr:hypothetical protein JHK86_038892 [Glycine max]KAG5109489.1 hypothetical protein JHK82_038712 [Glycine max]KAH1211598.1 Protein SMG7 [Glycine max]
MLQLRYILYNSEFAAASSYYLQAATIWPSSGNPHHQLALLASYSGDELAAIYCYFRSLAVDSPFTTARDNLIVAFEKNRQSYSQFSGDVKALAVNGRGKGEAKLVTKDTGVETSRRKGGASNIQDTYKSFCTCLVRLNGILITHTSLETLTEVLSLLSANLRELLSSGQDEELNFGTDTLQNKLAIVRVVSTIIFTVHNVNKESEGQTYAEIVQHAVLLQNAFTVAFEFMSLVVERCMQLRDPSCSYLLPGILVFVEWLACYPYHAAGNDVDENQATVRSKFWNHCVSFLNKLLSVWSMSIEDDEEETCFNNMSRYEEGETKNRLALWEDFELRGFGPLLPAQTILDFSRKNSIGSDSEKERKARVKRILAAGKALANVVRIDQKMIYFDSKGKKFVIGVQPQISDDFVISSYSGMPNAEDLLKDNMVVDTKVGIGSPDHHQYIEGEEDDEVIVFKPIGAEKRADVVVSSSRAPHEGLESVPTASIGNIKFNVNSTSNPLNDVNHQISLPASVSAMVPQHQQPVQPHSSSTSMFHAHDLSKAEDFAISSKIEAIASSGTFTENSVVKTSSTLQAGLKKSPVNRPSRHLGPPPGFSHVPPKQCSEPTVSDLISGNPIMDDYSWLDGYQLPASTNGLGPNGPLTYSQSNSRQVGNNGLSGTVSFPFPGKQIPSTLQVEKQNGWQDFQTSEILKAHHNQQLQSQLLPNGNQYFTPLPDQFQGQSIWTGQYFT